MKHKVLVIGMDSAPLSLVLPWVEAGKLPNIKKVFDSGSHGDLFSEIPVTPVAWSTIYTGKNPGKHGILGFKNHIPNSYSEYVVNSTARDAKDVWEIIGAHGGKVVVVNGPLTYPPRPVNGFLVTGFMSPDTSSHFAFPPSLVQDILRVFPRYRFGTPPAYIKSLYTRELHSTVHMVGETARSLLKRGDWDFAMVVFKETDEVQHSFYEAPERMLSLYRRVDAFIGEFLKLSGESPYVILVSDHGGEPLKKRFNWAEFLRRKGLIGFKETPGRQGFDVFTLGARLMNTLKLQWVLDVPGSRFFLGQLMKIGAKSDDGVASRFYGGTIDWGKTTAFISSGVGLRINVKGREPDGIVSEANYQEMKERVAKQLADLRDPENGARVFRQALPREQVLSGPHLTEAPDVLCLPDTGYLPTEALVSFDPSALASEKGSLFSTESPWQGTHTPFGLFAMCGPGVTNATVKNASLIDVAPTILYSMGLPVPEDMDGRVLTEAFDPAFLKANPVKEEAGTGRSEVAASVLPEDEERMVEERLRRLGYLS